MQQTLLCNKLSDVWVEKILMSVETWKGLSSTSSSFS